MKIGLWVRRAVLQGNLRCVTGLLRRRVSTQQYQVELPCASVCGVCSRMFERWQERLLQRVHFRAAQMMGVRLLECGVPRVRCGPVEFSASVRFFVQPGCRGVVRKVQVLVSPVPVRWIRI